MQKNIKTPSPNSTPEIQIIPKPDTDLLRRISTFHIKEAKWPSTVFELTVTLATFAISTDPNGELLGVASIHSLIPSNYWIGNVVVAAAARKQGLASRLVSALLRYAEQRSGPTNVVLVASRLGVNVYRRLGFIPQKNVAISVYERREQPPPVSFSLKPRYPDETLHDAAIKLDEEAIGTNRSSLLRGIYNSDRLCSVLTVDSQVVAAAWGRLSSSMQNRMEELHVGPVVAKSPDFAISVVAELLRMEHRRRRGHNKGNESCRFSTVLVVEKGTDERSRRVFEALGFVQGAELPYMAKRLESRSISGPANLDLVEATSQYFAMAGWDIC